VRQVGYLLELRVIYLPIHYVTNSVCLK